MPPRDRGRGGSVFDHAPSVTPTAVDSAIFGEIASVDQGKQTANPVSIFRVWPDPAQPRRVVPSAVRTQWDGTTVAALLMAWFEMAQQEKGGPISVAAYIESDSEDQINRNNRGPIETALVELLMLAGTIFREGLTNSVTAIRMGATDYRIETGERRWLAYHLLYAYTNESPKWEKIPLRVAPDKNVWRQASENTARANLNAIGKARQLANLLMDLLSPDHEFASIETFKSEREYYAQVADGERYRVPRGKGELLLSAMGLSNPVQLRQYRALLRLSDDIWQRADDENWSEIMIRESVNHADTVTKVTVSEPTEHPSDPKLTTPKTSPKPIAAVTEKFVRRSVKQASTDPVARASLIEIFENAIADLRKLT